MKTFPKCDLCLIEGLNYPQLTVLLIIILLLNPHLLMEHDSQFKVSKEIVSVAQITTGSSLSPSIPKFFYNGQISPENKSNKHVKAHSITVHAEMSTARDLQPGVSLFCTSPLPLNVNSPTTPHPQTDPCQRLNMCKNVPETIL